MQLLHILFYRQRRALGDVSESQINSRQKGTSESINQKGSKLNLSVSKANKSNAKIAAPTIFVQDSSPKIDRTVSHLVPKKRLWMCKPLIHRPKLICRVCVVLFCNPMLQDDMLCSDAGLNSHQRDLYLEVDRGAAKKCSSMSSRPGKKRDIKFKNTLAMYTHQSPIMITL